MIELSTSIVIVDVKLHKISHACIKEVFRDAYEMQEMVIPVT